MAVNYPGLNTLLGQINDEVLNFNKHRSVMQFLVDARGDVANDITEDRILNAAIVRATTSAQNIVNMLGAFR